MQVLLLSALFTIAHFFCFSYTRYSAAYLRALPKWATLLRLLPFSVCLTIDWCFCYLYMGLGCYIGRRLFRQVLGLQSGLISDPLGIALVVMVLNSLFYLVAVWSGSSNPYVLAFIQEFWRILLSDLVVLISIFYLGAAGFLVLDKFNFQRPV